MLLLWLIRIRGWFKIIGHAIAAMFSVQSYLPPETSIQKALRHVAEQMQVMKFRYESSPPMNRSDILAESGKRLEQMSIFVGKRDGTEVFRSMLIGLAAYLTFAAAAIDDKSIGVE